MHDNTVQLIRRGDFGTSEMEELTQANRHESACPQDLFLLPQ